MIRVLPPEVANKIAAGEVVERPASVVKELMENALDAGADTLTVEVRDGGLSYIRVTDNGCGMNAEDAETAFLRHATSKITAAEDLERILTLGFRGEALASIAAVSRVSLLTKQKEKEGVSVCLEGGRITENIPAGCPDGTTITVTDLFFNTPARMKFMKKTVTENGHIVDLVQRLVLGNPHVSVRLIADGRERLFFGGDGKTESAVLAVYGREYAKNLIPVSMEEGELKVEGVIGTEALHGSTRSRQSIYVNGRYVRHQRLGYLVENAYLDRLMNGKHPFFILKITLPCELVDINVHPTKQEVKFADEHAVGSLVGKAVRTALEGRANQRTESLLGGVPVPKHIQRREVSVFAPKAKEIPSEREQTKIFVQEFLKKETEPVKKEEPVVIKVLEPSAPKAPEPIISPIIKPEVKIVPKPAEPSFSPAPATPKKLAEPVKALREYRYVGQVFGTYLVLERDETMILIDQHAAHERVIYEKLRARRKDAPSQVLLSPAVVSLTPVEYEMVNGQKEALAEMGFELEDFGGGSFLVRQVPADIAAEEISSLLPLVAQQVEEGIENRDRALYTIACKAAVKANHKLSDEEVYRLADEILAMDGADTCPHGRPLYVTYTKYELEKLFKRSGI